MSDVTALLQGNKLIDVDENGQISHPILVLSSRGGHKIGVIQNVSNVNITHPLSDVAELSFDVTKEVNGETYKDWDKLKDFKLIQIPYENSWFEATVSIDEENEIVKHVTCSHANEAELGQLNLYETEINTENDIARDDYVETVFYNELNPKASLLHRVLSDKAPHYQIYHVDDSLKKIFRVFSFNGVSIQDALNTISEEVNCIFIYGEWFENDGKYHRTISAYDLEDYCEDCHSRGEYLDGVCPNCGSSKITTGYGEDTGIFISKENLASSINYDSNSDNVKNCFRLVAGDDVMTSAIKSCNPSMSQYMWYFSDDMLEDMSQELSKKITDYEALVESYKKDKVIDIHPNFIDTYYNSYIDEYGAMNKSLVKIDTPIKGTAKLTEAYYNAMNLYGFLKSEMMPLSEKVEDTTADDQLALLKKADFTEVGIASVSETIPYTTANSAIQSYAKVFIDTSRYKVNVFTNDINGVVWNGTVTVTSYKDDDDTATGSFTITLFDSTNNEKYADWLEQSVKKTMASREASDVSVVNLFKRNETLSSFTKRLELYSLDYLNIMSSMATSAITVMSEQGVASQNSLDSDIYTELYKPYIEKSKAIQDEIKYREEQLAGLLRPIGDNGEQIPEYQAIGLLDIIVDKQEEIRKELDLHDYLGDDLWEELSFYRRETEYSNKNYISDGLSDAEVIEQAQNFIDTASKEIIKASTLQHTISAPLYNLLLMDEFDGLQKKFKVGNWIWLQVDGKTYKLRLANWEIDYDNIDDLDIEFTDAIRVGSVISDVESILSKSKSMATTYDYTVRQAEKGKEASNTVRLFRDTGIDFNSVKAITSKGNTNIVYDDDGILLKRVVDGYKDAPEQARIYNNGIYITRDAWDTVSTGLGHFSYVDPETGETVNTYGIIADTVIGKLILGENLKVYSESGKFEMGDTGLIVTAKTGTDNDNLFTIQKDTGEKDGDGKPIIEKYVYVDKDGNINVTGNSIVVNGATDSYKLDDARKVASNYLSADSSGIMVADMRYGAHDPSSPVGQNVLIDNTKVDIRSNSKSLASFGATTRIGVENGRNVTIDDDSIDIIYGNDSLASFSQDVRVGRDISSHMMISPDSISAYSTNNNLYFQVGDGSNVAYQTYNVGAVPIDLSLKKPIHSITSILINNTRIYNFSFNSGESVVHIDDRPTQAISVAVNYTYDVEGSEDEGYSEKETTENFTFSNLSLTIPLNYPSDRIFNVVPNNYTISGNNIVYSQRPESGTVVQIEYRLSNTSPYFTFTNRGSGNKGSGSVSFSNGGVANGESSFITGIRGSVSGRGAFASGVGSESLGAAGSAMGNGTKNLSVGGLAVGSYNDSSEGTLFAVGNGTTSNRSNAFSVLSNGNTITGGRLLGGTFSSPKPLFKIVTVSVDKIDIPTYIGAYPSVAVNESGYTPIAISSYQISDASNWVSGYAHHTWCIMAYYNLNGNYISCYVGNWSTSYPARIKLTFKVLCIKSSAL